MHYKNGREAKSGDPVIGKTWDKGPVIAGVIHSLVPGSTSCNAQVAYPMPGMTGNACITVGDFFHAEDALAVMSPAVPPPTEQAPTS